MIDVEFITAGTKDVIVDGTVVVVGETWHLSSSHFVIQVVMVTGGLIPVIVEVDFLGPGVMIGTKVVGLEGIVVVQGSTWHLFSLHLVIQVVMVIRELISVVVMVVFFERVSVGNVIFEVVVDGVIEGTRLVIVGVIVVVVGTTWHLFSLHFVINVVIVIGVNGSEVVSVKFSFLEKIEVVVIGESGVVMVTFLEEKLLEVLIVVDVEEGDGIIELVVLFNVEGFKDAELITLDVVGLVVGEKTEVTDSWENEEADKVEELENELVGILVVKIMVVVEVVKDIKEVLWVEEEIVESGVVVWVEDGFKLDLWNEVVNVLVDSQSDSEISSDVSQTSSDSSEVVQSSSISLTVSVLQSSSSSEGEDQRWCEPLW